MVGPSAHLFYLPICYSLSLQYESLNFPLQDPRSFFYHCGLRGADLSSPANQLATFSRPSDWFRRSMRFKYTQQE